MKINKIDELEKGKLYWITIKEASLELMERTAERCNAKGVHCIISNYEVEFNKIPKGMRLVKSGNGFIVEN